MKIKMKLRKLAPSERPSALLGLPNATPPIDSELLIYGDIGESWFGDSVEALDVVQQLQSLDTQHVLVRINSYGGSVTDGTAIYNALRGLGVQITTRIEGIAASVASLIAMAGDEVQMSANTLLMIHAPWTMVAGNSAEMREQADVLDVFAQGMATSYARKTGNPLADELTQLTDGADHWFTAQSAKDAGYCDVIVDEAQTPEETSASAKVIVAAIARYRSAPLAIAASYQSHIAAAIKAAAKKPKTTAALAATQQESRMNWKALAKAYGLKLAENADDAAAKAAVIVHLNLQADASEESIAAAIAARSASPGVSPANAQPQNRGAQTPEALAAAVRAEDIQSMFVVARRARPNDTRLPEMEAQALIDTARPAAQVRTELLAHMSNGANPIAGTHVAVQAGEDEADKRRAAMTAALLARVNRATPEQKASLGANPYRGQRLIDMAEHSLSAIGVAARGFGRQEIAEYALGRRDHRVSAANTTSDFPVVLENTLHKILLNGYAAAAQTWMKFCKTMDVSDYRNWNMLVPGALGNLEDVNESGEYKQKNIPDATKNTVQAIRRGNIIEITPEVLVNDDIGYILQVAESLGQAGARTIERKVYDTLNSNPVLVDGYALFSAQHGNLTPQGSGAPPTMAQINAMIVAMGSQKLPGDTDDYMDIMPSIAVTSLATAGPLRQIIQSPFDPDANNKLQRPNIVYNAVETIVGSPRVGVPTAWYFFADPTIAPVLVVAFLDGQREPTLKQDENFRTAGIKWRAELPFGIGIADYRGVSMNYGA